LPALLLDAALGYATGGWPVFPVVPRGKVPATPRGFHDATLNPETIRRHWRVPDRNVASPTGPVSGFWVLDIDGAEGEANLARLEAEHGRLPPTRTALTGGGGRHFLFRYTGPIQSSVGRIATAVDVRCDLAYVVLAPSMHPSGRTYAWADGEGSSYEIATAPDWIVRAARKRPTTISERAAVTVAPRAPDRTGAYGRAALAAEIVRLRDAGAGCRNVMLNRVAFRLHQLVAGNELDGQHVVERLVDACHTNGLVADDGLASVVRTINSAANAGLRFPRSRSGRPAR
jgi:hypothetical protein